MTIRSGFSGENRADLSPIRRDGRTRQVSSNAGEGVVYYASRCKPVPGTVACYRRLENDLII